MMLYKELRENNSTFNSSIRENYHSTKLFDDRPTDHRNDDYQQIPIINSPGGLATSTTYNSINESADLFGGSDPRYISQEYGHLYKAGDSEATKEMVLEPKYNTSAPNNTPYWDNMPKESYEWIGEEKKREPFKFKSNGIDLKLDKPVIDIVVIVLFYLAMTFLTNSATRLFVKQFGKGSDPDWKSYLMVSVVLFSIIVLTLILGRKDEK